MTTKTKEINQLMEDLMSDYKQSLINKEQVEKDEIDLIKMQIESLKNYVIPFYKSKRIFEAKSGKFFVMLPITALFFDIARINGYANGLFKKNKSI